MTRVMIMTFFGDRRWADDAHPHESPKVMTLPMAILAIGSVGAGVLVWFLPDYLAPVVGHAEETHAMPVWASTALTLGFVATGILFAVKQSASVPVIAPTGSFATVAARRDLYGDAVNEAVFMRPGRHLTRVLVFLDNRGIDGIVNTIGATLGGLSARIRRVQTGFVRSYALQMVTGALIVAAAMVWVGTK
jgi:NADH-quinone oxidoreductase subunit L